MPPATTPVVRIARPTNLCARVCAVHVFDRFSAGGTPRHGHGPRHGHRFRRGHRDSFCVGTASSQLSWA